VRIEAIPGAADPEHVIPWNIGWADYSPLLPQTGGDSMIDLTDNLVIGCRPCSGAGSDRC
jgi:hypothetical protein